MISATAVSACPRILSASARSLFSRRLAACVTRAPPSRGERSFQLTAFRLFCAPALLRPAVALARVAGALPPLSALLFSLLALLFELLALFTARALGFLRSPARRRRRPCIGASDSCASEMPSHQIEPRGARSIASGARRIGNRNRRCGQCGKMFMTRRSVASVAGCATRRAGRRRERVAWPWLRGCALARRDVAAAKRCPAASKLVERLGGPAKKLVHPPSGNGRAPDLGKARGPALSRPP